MHHARKASINPSENSYQVTATEIRGGSAIRGEADVILGLAKNPGGSGGGAKMTLIMEARNHNLEDISLVFEENNLIFKKAAVQWEESLKERLHKLLKDEEAPLRKSEVVSTLAEEWGLTKQAAGRRLEKFKNIIFVESKAPHDKRIDQIELKQE